MAEIKNPVTIVKGGGESTLITNSITENGTYNASDDNADGYSAVNVNVASENKLHKMLVNEPFTLTADDFEGVTKI